MAETLSDVTIQSWPGPIRTASTPSKPIPKTFSRRWQARIPIDPDNCPFENRPQNVAAVHERPDGDGWKVLISTTKSEPYHHLIIPQTCKLWPEERTRTLGGRDKIAEAIEIAARKIRDERLRRAQFSVQIGPLAAQNVAHLHYHLYQLDNLEGEDILAATLARYLYEADGLKKLAFFWDDDFIVVAGGHRTGQSLFIPKSATPFGPYPSFGPRTADMLAHLVDLYSTKFKSVEGMPPDYRFELSIRDDQILFGLFVPVLNQIGTMEDMALFSPETRRFNLAWSHEETARYLRGE